MNYKETLKFDDKYMTYKLIKEYPNRKIGDVAYSKITANPNELSFLWVSDNTPVPSDFQCDITPEWFSKVLFTTVDGYDIVEGEVYFALCPEISKFVRSIADEESLKSDWVKYKYCITDHIDIMSYNIAADILEGLYEEDDILRGGTIYTSRFDGEIFNEEAEKLISVIQKIILNYFEN